MEDYGLRSINLKVWMDMIFINFHEGSSFNIPFKDIKDHIYPLDISSYKYHSRVSYDIESNWKTYIDNYLEGYHIPFVHPKLNKIIDYKSYQTELFENYSLQWSPIKPDLSPYKKSEISLSKAFYFTIFPNLLLNIAPGRLQANIVEPRSSKTCTVHFDYYFEDINDKSIDDDFSFSDEVQQEDIQICQEVQKGLESHGFDKGRISKKSEKGLHHFQSILKRCFRNG
jgi:choline monooxygenase